MEDFKFYEVGGKIRDELLGLKSKDVDYVAVPNDAIIDIVKAAFEEAPAVGLLPNVADQMFSILKYYLEEQKFEIFLVTPACYTIRAKFPEGYKYQGVADFVMARKEVGYIPGTRTPIVEPGNLYDDLSRRDFTVNAMAKDPDTGEIIDYFDGMKDLENRILRTPLDPKVTFDDDPLRILRGIRFAITKGFFMSGELQLLVEFYDYDTKMPVVSEERIREELCKMFKHDTMATLDYLQRYWKLSDYIFTHTKLWLKPTNEK